jgi:hypothetical protein
MDDWPAELSSSELLGCLVAEQPAFRSNADLDRIDPAELSGGEKVDLLTGYGPITADTARRLAADQSGTWRRLLTDPDTGALLDISPHRYRPAQRTRDYLAARDDVCVFPTCSQPAYRCEPDHTIPFNQGGRTRRDNLALTCRRHKPSQSRHRLDLPAQPRRQLRLDHRNRPPLHRTTTLVTGRTRMRLRLPKPVRRTAGG